MFKNIVKYCLSLLGAISLFTQPVEACTRALFVGSSDVVITGRSMDWYEDMQSDLWAFPKGMKKDGAAGKKSITWTSKYGSVIVSCYNIGTADGMNEKGLVANVLYLVESDYGVPVADKPLLSIVAWAQYALDNFSSVSEAVEILRQEPFSIVAPRLPNGSPAQLHLSISDPTGDSAIFEYVEGKLVIHHNKEYKIMTNSPIFSQQLALNAYWKSINGTAFLPGTSRAADRFARASFYLQSLPQKSSPEYINAVPQKEYENLAGASVLSLVRSVSVPLGASTPSQPNIASTLWRTISDQKNKRYFFDSATSPNVFWVDLSDLQFEIGSPVKKLSVSKGNVFSGNVASFFEKAEPFKFLSASELNEK